MPFCLPFHPQVEEEVAKDVSVLETTLEADLKSFGRGFTVLESRIAQELRAEEGTVAREVGAVGGPACAAATGCGLCWPRGCWEQPASMPGMPGGALRGGS